MGWIEPTVVTGLEPGESVEISIGAFADTGDAIVIPAADALFDGPFGEYIIIDLMTDGGVNRYDASAWGLGDVHGVRISHVNSLMEKRVLTDKDGVEYPVGTIHFGNESKESGIYLLEVIQAGKRNTFTDVNQLRAILSKEDLFQAGDVFTAEAYSEFFPNGLMDDGSAFGYQVDIVRRMKRALTTR